MCLFGGTKRTDDEGPSNDGGDDEGSTDAIRKKTRCETTADEVGIDDDECVDERQNDDERHQRRQRATAARTFERLRNEDDRPPDDWAYIATMTSWGYCAIRTKSRYSFFPHEDALQLEDGLRLAEGRCKSNNIDISNDAKEEKKKMTLIFIDATWKYAKEMEKCTDSDNQWPENLIRVRITPPSSTSTSTSS